MIAALYVAITMVLQPLSFNYIQFRASEALTVLPILMPESIPALFVGVIFANALGSPLGILDIVFGPILTLIAAVLTYYLRKRELVALLCPIIVNSLGVSAYLAPIMGVSYLWSVLWIAIGESGVIFILGWPLLKILKRHPEVFGGQND